MKKFTCILAIIVLGTAAHAQTYKPIFAKPLVVGIGSPPTGGVTITTNPLSTPFTLQLPLDDGAANQVLTTDGAGILSWVAAGGGLVNFTESVNTAAPNATVPVVRLLATNAATDVDVALTPKGSGALLAHIPDNGIAGGNKRGTYAVDWQRNRNANTQVASGAGAVIGGGQRNTASGFYSVVGGGTNNSAGAGRSFIGGGELNLANTFDYSTIVGGYNNTSLGEGDFIGGGYFNTTNGISVVAGGQSNTANGSYSAITGGFSNSASGIRSFIGGGFSNLANNSYATIAGGNDNTASGNSSVIGGGQTNTASGDYSSVGGGINNIASGAYSAIPGGRGLTLDASADRSFGFLAYDGANAMTISAAATAVFGNTDLWLANNDGAARGLVFFENYSGSGAFPNTANQIRVVAPASISADYSLTLPVDGGAANQVLATDGAGVLSWVAAGGLTNFTESVNTAAPNATVPVVQLLATNAATNVDIALTPKGTGALTAQVADNIAGGGNKRGAYAVDWQRGRSSNTMVASGNLTVIAGGNANTASGNTSTVGGGDNNTANGDYSAVGGGAVNTASGSYSAIPGGVDNTASGYISAVGGGWFNTASGNYSTVIGGKRAIASNYGQMAQSSSRFASNGDAQTSVYVAHQTTTDATPSELFLDDENLSARIAVAASSALRFHALVIGMTQNGANVGSYEISGCITRDNANNTAIVGNVNQTDFDETAGAAAWDATAVADNTNEALVIQVTGAAATTIRWVARVETSEVVFP